LRTAFFVVCCLIVWQKVAFNNLSRLPPFPPNHAVWISHHGNPLAPLLGARKQSTVRMLSPRSNTLNNSNHAAANVASALADGAGHGVLYSADLEARAAKLAKRRRSQASCCCCCFFLVAQTKKK
jgi:hypothetical protein